MASASQSDWKSKYLDTLDDLEKKEKNWGEMESTLKKTVSRLSLALLGESPQLDKNIMIYEKPFGLSRMMRECSMY